MQRAQIGEQGRDLAADVLVDAVQADEGIEGLPPAKSLSNDHAITSVAQKHRLPSRSLRTRYEP